MKTQFVARIIGVVTIFGSAAAFAPHCLIAAVHHRSSSSGTASQNVSTTLTNDASINSSKDSANKSTQVNTSARLPFNLNWGDSREKLSVFLKGSGATVKERRVSSDGKREVWNMDGLLRPGPKVQSVKLIFITNALSGIELQYSQPDWDTVTFNDVMGTLRKQLEHDFNDAGTLISRRTEEVHLPNQVSNDDKAESEGDDSQLRTASNDIVDPANPTDEKKDDVVTQTLTGYEWKTDETIAQLFYFSVEKAADKNMSYRTISIHYRYRDPVQDDGKTGPNSGLPNANSSDTNNIDPLPQK